MTIKPKDFAPIPWSEIAAFLAHNMRSKTWLANMLGVSRQAVEYWQRTGSPPLERGPQIRKLFRKYGV